MRWLLAILLLTGTAVARDPNGLYDKSPFKAWYSAQHNSQGGWCCDQADGHAYLGDYTVNADGSVTLQLTNGPHVIPKEYVLTGPNPTGHAVWWNLYGVDYCFAPGTMG